MKQAKQKSEIVKSIKNQYVYTMIIKNNRCVVFEASPESTR